MTENRRGAEFEMTMFVSGSTALRIDFYETAVGLNTGAIRKIKSPGRKERDGHEC
jgi:hypothetical protein